MQVNILRRRFAVYLPFARWGGIAIAAISVIFLLIKVIFPAVSSLAVFIGKSFNTLSIFQNPEKSLKSIDGRTNILILGKGGDTHEAPGLTDSIMILSIRHSDRTISVISVPRDVWISSMKAKINSAYYYGEQKQQDGGGFILARDAVFQVTDLPIQYTVLIDFAGFKRAIDLVGGVDIQVDYSFTDEKYPVEDERGGKPTPKPSTTPLESGIYERVHFEQGSQQMDGTTALKFARSRNSTDSSEGTDFARSKRQQKVFIAFAQKMKQKETAFNLDRLKELRGIFDQYTMTDLLDQELLALGKIGLGIDPSTIRRIGLDEGTKESPGILVNPPVAKFGQWVLESRAKDWSDVHAYIEEQLQ